MGPIGDVPPQAHSEVGKASMGQVHDAQNAPHKNQAADRNAAVDSHVAADVDNHVAAAGDTHVAAAVRNERVVSPQISLSPAAQDFAASGGLEIGD